MIQELLLFMLLFQFSNSEKWNYTNCKEDGGQLLGPGNVVCNQREYIGYLDKYVPCFYKDNWQCKTDIKIEKINIILIFII